jgi:ABC-type sugar transport system ATPase subunit
VDVPGRGPEGRLRVDLALTPGELVALEVTPLAATAVARTVVGLAQPRDGRVVVGRSEVTRSPPADRQIGYVPAHDSLLPSLSMERNICYGLRRHDGRGGWLRRGWRDAAHPRSPADRQAQDRVERLTTALGLGPTLRLRPHELDDGQRFHAAVARAVAGLNEVLVIDLPHPVPGALPLPEVMDRIRTALPQTVTTAVLTCTADSEVMGGADRVVVVEPPPPPPPPADPGGAGA